MAPNQDTCTFRVKAMNGPGTQCTIVQYHYIRKDSDVPRLKGLDVAKFEAQLDYIRHNYAVISLNDYVQSLGATRSLGRKLCVLTFDDGTKDHYANAFPILKEKKLTASFFPMTQPLKEHRVAAFHKVHLLLLELGSRRFADSYNHMLKNDFPELCEKHLVDEKIKLNPKYKWDDNLTANLKVSVAALPANVKRRLLDTLFSEFVDHENDLCDKLYMNLEEMQEMQESGMSFGCHSHTHPMLADLPPTEQREEIQLSKQVIESMLKAETDSFSYPYGSYNQRTIAILKEEGFRSAVTTDFAVNTEDVDPFRLKRVDTNDIPLK
jgi:peptidoglycan/xylan/chitin deacetylase (PgdA/CDA1 family)